MGFINSSYKLLTALALTMAISSHAEEILNLNRGEITVGGAGSFAWDSPDISNDSPSDFGGQVGAFSGYFVQDDLMPYFFLNAAGKFHLNSRVPNLPAGNYFEVGLGVIYYFRTGSIIYPFVGLEGSYRLFNVLPIGVPNPTAATYAILPFGPTIGFSLAVTHSCTLDFSLRPKVTAPLTSNVTSWGINVPFVVGGTIFL